MQRRFVTVARLMIFRCILKRTEERGISCDIDHRSAVVFGAVSRCILTLRFLSRAPLHLLPLENDYCIQ